MSTLTKYVKILPFPTHIIQCLVKQLAQHGLLEDFRLRVA